MSRYIDAEALDRAFSKLRFNNDGELEHYGDRPNWYLWGSEVENLIDDAPSIDIVRCKECKHWIGETEHYEDREYKACWQLCGQYMNSEFWCKYGEREGE